MAFTVKGEYERLMKIKAECEKKSKDKWLGFECGCACGFVTRIEYLPKRYCEEIHDYLEEEIQVYVIAGLEDNEQLAFTLTENDVRKRYQDRRYKYWKQYGILGYFPYK